MTNTMIFTIVLAVIVTFLAILGLAIGWLLTGKTKLKRGTCGYVPKPGKEPPEDCNKDQGCSICNPKIKD